MNEKNDKKSLDKKVIESEGKNQIKFDPLVKEKCENFIGEIKTRKISPYNEEGCFNPDFNGEGSYKIFNNLLKNKNVSNTINNVYTYDQLAIYETKKSRDKFK